MKTQLFFIVIFSFIPVMARSTLALVAHASNQDIMQPTDVHTIAQERDMASVTKVCTVSYATQENIRGINGMRAYPNQDRIFVGSLAGRTGFGIFDGHGTDGGVIAAYVRDYLLVKIMGYRSIALGAQKACSWMQYELKKHKNKEAVLAGTTAVMGVLYDKTLTIINVGDSRVIKISADKARVEQLSIDHKPQEETERERIKSAGGFVYKGYVYNASGHGLALSRSFGDLSAHDGDVIICDPQVEIYSVVAGEMLVFASDGLWDVLSNERVRELVIIYEKKSIEDKQKQSLAHYLAQEARELKSRDDITVLVVGIKE